MHVCLIGLADRRALAAGNRRLARCGASLQENYGRLVGRGPLVLLFIDTADTAHARLLDVLRHVASAAATAHPNLSFGVISAVRCLNHTYVSASECKYARESLNGSALA
jgi:hypothetical protein